MLVKDRFNALVEEHGWRRKHDWRKCDQCFLLMFIIGAMNAEAGTIPNA